MSFCAQLWVRHRQTRLFHMAPNLWVRWRAEWVKGFLPWNVFTVFEWIQHSYMCYQHGLPASNKQFCWWEVLCSPELWEGLSILLFTAGVQEKKGLWGMGPVPFSDKMSPTLAVSKTRKQQYLKDKVQIWLKKKKIKKLNLRWNCDGVKAWNHPKSIALYKF